MNRTAIIFAAINVLMGVTMLVLKGWVAAIYVLIVGPQSMLSLSTIVFGVSGIKRFGWQTRQGLWCWTVLLVGLYGAYTTYDVTGGTLRPPVVYSAVALAYGVAGVAYLIFTWIRSPLWSLLDERGFTSLLPRWVLADCVIEFFVKGSPWAGSVLTGVALMGCLSILPRIERVLYATKTPPVRRSSSWQARIEKDAQRE